MARRFQWLRAAGLVILIALLAYLGLWEYGSYSSSLADDPAPVQLRTDSDHSPNTLPQGDSFLNEHHGHTSSDAALLRDPEGKYSQLSSNHSLEERINLPNPFKPKPKTPYQLSQARGCKLSTLLNDPSSAPQTEWTDYQSLQEWGWIRSVSNTAEVIKRAVGFIEASLVAVGVSLASPPMQNVIWQHQWVTSHGGNSYPPSNAMYTSLYNPVQGAIIAHNTYGPAYMQEKRHTIPADAPLPQLRSWSDVVYLTWASLTTPEQRTALRMVVRHNVVNQETRDIVHEALIKGKAPGGSLPGGETGVPPRWPGYSFTTQNRGGKGADTFMAVLGTPNVRGVAWLLIQHARELGDKTITEIQVWDPADFASQMAGWNLAIVVWIGPRA